MAGTRSPTQAPTTTETSGFTEDQRNELKALIQEAIGSAALSPPAAQAKSAPAVSEEGWGKMSDRQRQSLVSQLVDFRLDELARIEADADRDRKIADLQKKGQPERPPSTWSKIQGILWGSEPAKP